MGWVNLICNWNGCDLWWSFSYIHLITDFRYFEGRIRTFPLAGTGIWILIKTLHAPQLSTSSLNCGRFVFQAKCQLFGILESFLCSPVPASVPRTSLSAQLFALSFWVAATVPWVKACSAWNSSHFSMLWPLPYPWERSHKCQGRSFLSVLPHPKLLVYSCLYLVTIHREELAGGTDLLCGWVSLEFESI